MKKLFLSLCLAIMAFNSYALTCSGPGGKSLELSFQDDSVSGLIKAPRLVLNEFTGEKLEPESDVPFVKSYLIADSLSGLTAMLTHKLNFNHGQCNRVSCDSAYYLKSSYTIKGFGHSEYYECN